MAFRQTLKKATALFAADISGTSLKIDKQQKAAGQITLNREVTSAGSAQEKKKRKEKRTNKNLLRRESKAKCEA